MKFMTKFFVTFFTTTSLLGMDALQDPTEVSSQDPFAILTQQERTIEANTLKLFNKTHCPFYCSITYVMKNPISIGMLKVRVNPESPIHKEISGLAVLSLTAFRLKDGECIKDVEEFSQVLPAPSGIVCLFYQDQYGKDRCFIGS